MELGGPDLGRGPGFGCEETLQAPGLEPDGGGLGASKLATGLAGALLSVALSVGLLAAASAIARKAVLEMPDDFLWAPAGQVPRRVRARRTAFGLASMALGGLLLILPGPGVLLIVLGLLSCELPGRARLLHRLLRRRAVLGRVNALRARHGKPPLADPTTPAGNQRPSS